MKELRCGFCGKLLMKIRTDNKIDEGSVVIETEIKNYVLRREDEYRILGSYLNQSQMPSTKLRVYLIRHMFKVCNRFDLMRTTLHLAVFYLDLYFDKHILINDQL